MQPSAYRPYTLTEAKRAEAGPGVADPNAGPGTKMFSFRKICLTFSGEIFAFLLFPSKKSEDLFFSHLGLPQKREML